MADAYRLHRRHAPLEASRQIARQVGVPIVMPGTPTYQADYRLQIRGSPTPIAVALFLLNSGIAAPGGSPARKDRSAASSAGVIRRRRDCW